MEKQRSWDCFEISKQNWDGAGGTIHNEAKYEALIVELWLVLDVLIAHARVFSNSQLVMS